jgi:hypothetical protein
MKIYQILLVVSLFLLNGCGVYNFTGTGKIDAKTFQVNFFQNNADLVEPELIELSPYSFRI